MSVSQVWSGLSSEVVKVLTEATLALVLFSDASRVGLHPLRADLCLLSCGQGPA
jgi:hypothetical protein